MNLKEFLQKPPVWIKTEADDYNAFYSSARFTRNYKGYLFPDKNEKQRLRIIEIKTDKRLKSLLDSGDLIKLKIDALTDNELSILSERRVLPKIAIKERAAVRLYIYKDFKTFILINYKDHLNIYSHISGAKIKSAFNASSKLLKYFDATAFSTDKEGNYLTSNVNYHGTGFKPHIILTLPYFRFGKHLSKLISSFNQNGLIYTKYFNFGSDLEDLLVVSIADSYSITPLESVRKLELFYETISSLNTEVKDSIDKKTIEDLKIKLESLVNRDSLSFKVCIDLFFGSLIANDLDLLQKISMLKIKRALFDFQIGNLSHTEKKILREKDAALLRAERIKKMIK